MKILGDFLSNVAKMYADLLGYFERLHLLSETTVHTFWATFVKIGLLLIPTSGHTGQVGKESSVTHCLSGTDIYF